MIVPRLYHRTDAAEEIQREGFGDREGMYIFDRPQRGVWLSNAPLRPDQGVRGRDVLAVDVPNPTGPEYTEVTQDGRTYREWVVPAATVNAHRPFTLLTE